METNKLRQEYINFFKEKNHKVFPSDSLVPDDTSVLFTSAGMNRFKPYFLGEAKGVSSAVSCQRCLRTGDIERVGKTPYHHTFFEMLGNFSFGDYFKKEAIAMAWEFLVEKLKINKENLWVSVYKDDKEAFDIWKDEIGVPVDKIIKLGQSENFWPANVIDAGPCGPCGPCAEIFFDRGKSKGCQKDSCNPSCGCARFVEIWNLVFTQFDRQPDGSLKALPQKNIDTGMGLERMASVLQNKDSNFEIDILAPARDELKKILKLPADFNKNYLVNSIVDHARAVIFSVADGVYPSNEERGYVVRKLLRKALWGANLIGYKEPFIYKLIPLFVELMQKPYPFIAEKAQIVEKVVKAEEEKFILTLDEGKSKLKEYLDQLKKEKKKILSADKLFFLYDTYGFPFELSETAAWEFGVGIDKKGAVKLLAQQKERSRAGSKFSPEIFKKDYSLLAGKEPTKFTGYENFEISAQITDIFSLKGTKIDGKDKRQLLKKGQKGVVILNKTPFYTEAGGQLSDRGVIKTSQGRFYVENAYRIGAESVACHQGEVIEGVIKEEKAKAVVDKKRRKALARAHTATHLLQASLREILGEHVSQQGSLVDEDRLRFDFTHFKGLDSSQIERIESLVNFYILKADKVCKEKLSFQEAKKKGALAFFKEKYGDEVRMVSISDYSKELCGGTHLDNSSEIAGFAIAAESSVSSGIRRIEAVVGSKFYQAFRDQKNKLIDLAKMLKCSPVKLKPALAKKIKSHKDCKSRMVKLEKEKVSDIAEKLINKYLEPAGGTSLLIYNFTEIDSLDLNYSNFFDLADLLKDKLESFFAFFIGRQNSKLRFISFCSKDLNDQGISCKDFINSVKDELPLKGGGTDKLAQGVVTRKDRDLTPKIKSYFVRFLGNESN
ncbi:MAG: alanine--tRNA ligase [Candidatus Omnitrophica bacterium]|nr:alanine--tRNA ligase [Candidatus Omnitrophota bacterium]MCF7878418.1 alanine--tRNA ligase [Candidatus Omnitrophota bacterium]MCF7892937.1 alanine--tRNA ligase [Candidatus Omnitrophota bacterium]